jgi:hypothetical protein
MEKLTNNSAQLATIIHRFSLKFNTKIKLPNHKLRVLDALQKCRTKYMGGHIEACEACGEIREAFNSCRNRHCPKCGAIDKEKWIVKREQDLLPIKYFHVIFTVPNSLNALFLNNQKEMYNLLFTTAWDVLSDFGNTKKWAGGKLGAITILHTWGQKLNYHPHLHFIIPAGVLTDNNKWKHSRNRGKYLFSVKQLSSVFRARFVEQTRRLITANAIEGILPNDLFAKQWVVYAKQPFGGPKQVINYLGRYTHRTAISNDRIIYVDSTEVCFSWRDYSDNYALKKTNIKGEDFIALFSQHILPWGFTRIRHYGFLSSASKTKSLAIIRSELKTSAPTQISKDQLMAKALERMKIKFGICAKCGGKTHIIETFSNSFRQSQRGPPRVKNRR